MEKKSGDESYFITKDEIIEKFGIDVPAGRDTWSYYRNNILEIKIAPEVKPSTKQH